MSERLRDDLKRRLWDLGDSLETDAPDLILILQMALIWRTATALLGPELWRELGRGVAEDCRHTSGLCQHCDAEIPPHKTHRNVCPDCDQKFKEEYLGQIMELGGEGG